MGSWGPCVLGVSGRPGQAPNFRQPMPGGGSQGLLAWALPLPHPRRRRRSQKPPRLSRPSNRAGGLAWSRAGGRQAASARQGPGGRPSKGRKVSGAGLDDPRTSPPPFQRRWPPGLALPAGGHHARRAGPREGAAGQTPGRAGVRSGARPPGRAAGPGRLRPPRGGHGGSCRRPNSHALLRTRAAALPGAAPPSRCRLPERSQRRRRKGCRARAERGASWGRAAPSLPGFGPGEEGPAANREAEKAGPSSSRPIGSAPGPDLCPGWPCSPSRGLFNPGSLRRTCEAGDAGWCPVRASRARPVREGKASLAKRRLRQRQRCSKGRRGGWEREARRDRRVTTSGVPEPPARRCRSWREGGAALAPGAPA